MLSTLLLAAPVAIFPSSAPVSPPGIPAASTDELFDERFRAANKDAEKLWDLFLWCESTERAKEGRKVLNRLVRVDPDHKEAHEKLGHIYYDKRWFRSEKKLDEYKTAEFKRKLKEQGLVEYNGEAVRPEDVPFLEKGLVKDEKGLWITEEELQRRTEGWLKQDFEWIDPDDADKVEAGLWKCEDNWLSLEEANEFHSTIDRAWRIPGQHVILNSTVDRQSSERAVFEMERAFKDLVRIFGRAPEEPLEVMLLRDSAQYSRIGGGDYGQVDARGLSSIHYAFFGDSWFEGDSYRGMGIGYWDASTDAGAKFGVHSARLALGFSFANAADPSPETIAQGAPGERADGWVEEFLAEKTLPEWFRAGAAVYGERYFEDQFQKDNTWWARQWSIGNIAGRGGLDELDRIFDFDLNPGDPEASGKLLNEAGLLVAFVLDGGCEPVRTAHAKLKKALVEGKDPKKIALALRKAIAKNEDELRRFAEL